MGYCDDPAILDAVPRRVFLDIDPGFPQMWRALGLHDAFAGHDRFATLARNIGTPGCTIPTCGLDWITLPQPIVLDETFEQAFDIHEGDRKDIDALEAHGWRLVDPLVVAAGPDAYRRYVAASKAEFVVPKHMYVETRGGLLSDRSAAYLASGRPVLARDTGLDSLYPLGSGLVTFTTPDEAVAGVAAIATDYLRHCRAAREIAAAEFDSDRVLSRFLEDILS